MRIIVFSLLALFMVTIASCCKDKEEKLICEMKNCSVCDDKRFDNKDAVKDHYIDKYSNKVELDVEKYILSPLVKDDECGYIVSGKIKYLVNGKTAAIVDYGDGEIDAWAVKTIYYSKDNDRDCDKGGKDKGHYNKGKKDCDDDDDYEYTKCCKFKQECIKNKPATTNTALSVGGTTINS